MRVLTNPAGKGVVRIGCIARRSAIDGPYIQGGVMAQFSAAPHNPAIPAFNDEGPAADPGMPAGYSERLYNEDLAPLRHQTWSAYNIFAFWMSDVHSVGGYVFAGSLFALGLTSWQVLISLLVGIGF